MSIIEQLAKDLTQLVENELSRDDADVDRLYLLVLQLIGGWRGGGKPRTNLSVKNDWDEEEREDEENDGHEEEDMPDGKVVELNTLHEQHAVFRRPNPYLNGLLFRDYSAGTRHEDHYLRGFGRVRVHSEACLYVDEVLWLRRLQPARKIGAEPTNLHLLLQSLCRQSLAVNREAWSATRIQRQKDAQIYIEAWFEKVAKALQTQRARLGDGRISAVARNAREKYGPYWLEADVCREQVGEELSLREVLEIAPKPLHEGFGEQPDVARLLRRVVDSLNTRYRLLRACGLPPADWLHRDEPSIDRLKDLAQLRKQAVLNQAWQHGERDKAFAAAFASLLEREGGKLGGFRSFEDWLGSEEGYAMYYRDSQEISLSEILRETAENHEPMEWETADTGEDVEKSILLKEVLSGILETAGRRLTSNPVLQTFFVWALVEQRELEGKQGLFQQASFQELCAMDTKYSGLSPAELQGRLFDEARDLILDVLVEKNPEPEKTSEKIDLVYLRWVVIEGKPEQGKNGLFTHDFFQNLLAEDAELAALSPEMLSQRLRGRALDLISKLFGKFGLTD